MTQRKVDAAEKEKLKGGENKGEQSETKKPLQAAPTTSRPIHSEYPHNSCKLLLRIISFAGISWMPRDGKRDSPYKKLNNRLAGWLFSFFLV